MLDIFFKKNNEKSISIIPILTQDFSAWLKKQSAASKSWIEANRFQAQSASICILPSKSGQIDKVLIGMRDIEDWWAIGALPGKLPAGFYKIVATHFDKNILQNALVAWGLGSYKFDCYKKNEQSENQKPKLFLPADIDSNYLENIVGAIYWVRNLINLPADDLGPEELADAASQLTKIYGAKMTQFVGEKLRKANFPAVYAVGKGSVRAPRLIDIRWGKKTDPKITLVGKGVCFDSGGLCLKPSVHMRHMNKDMAGAAHALGLARMIMAAQLPINLRVIIPAVENLASGTSYKPSDILKARSGKTIEVCDTDAEGRLILADALTLASEDQPELLLDFASLTGAARVALGLNITALFTNNDKLANDLLQETVLVGEELWRMPLHRAYRGYLDSKFADIANISSVPYGGAITAALFLQEFVTEPKNWVHLDLGSWNEKFRPGHPEGAEAYCIRGIFNYLAARY